MVVGQVPALPAEQFLTQLSKSHEKSRQQTYASCCNCENLIIKQSATNTRRFIVPANKADQFQNSFFFLSLFFSSFVVHAACDRHQLWRSNQCFICLHLYICSQRSPLILKVQHLLKTGNWFYTVIPTTNPYWSELSPSNTECLYLLVGLLILLSKFFGLGVTQTPSTGLRHPSFNHCHI